MPAKERVVTTLSMESNHFSTLLSMDSSSLSHDKSGREFSRVGFAPPDINLPLMVSPSPLPCSDEFVLDVGLAAQHHDVVEMSCGGTKVGKKCAKRLDSVWGAWFFFNFYFKPAMNERLKGKVGRGSGSECDKSELKLDVFLVQHDMENIYMWVFKERPENALGKMQLRSYMNGHSRQGERPFPFSVDKGFVRSHRMQRKHYRGLSNPQCVHGIEIVRSPNLAGINEEERKKWMELTGRDLNFSIPLEASDFCSWRSVPTTEFVLERLPPLKCNAVPHPKRPLNGSSLNLSTSQPNNVNGEGIDANKRKKMFFPQAVDDDCFLSDSSHAHQIEPPWLTKCSGVMRHAYGPVTAAKTIYEDDEGFLIIVSMPFVDLKRVKVTWRNTVSHGTVKISCTSTGCAPTIKRQNRTFQLADPSPEHCPPGEFVREIPLRTRIPEDAKLEAFGDETGTMLEILVPKHRVGPEEHEVRVCLRSSPWREQYVGLAEAIV
nr:ATP-dependent 6-phosphofructokinase [Ipomoea batatas]